MATPTVAGLKCLRRHVSLPLLQTKKHIPTNVRSYLRLHVCYYNARGILVTHPRATMCHYLSGSFLVDFVACAPFDHILKWLWRHSFEDTVSYNKMYVILKLNRIVQIYRIPDASSMFTRDITTSRKIGV